LHKLTTPRIIAGNNEVPDITTNIIKIFIKTSLTNKPIPPVLNIKTKQFVKFLFK
jgi:hypothetical protein